MIDVQTGKPYTIKVTHPGTAQNTTTYTLKVNGTNAAHVPFGDVVGGVVQFPRPAVSAQQQLPIQILAIGPGGTSDITDTLNFVTPPPPVPPPFSGGVVVEQP